MELNLGHAVWAVTALVLVLLNSVDGQDPCLSSPCFRGVCKAGAAGYRCVCDANWFGTTCRRSKCPVPNRCQNGGTCKDGFESRWSCICPPGQGGAKCETKLVFCVNSPCQNGGTCIEGPQAATCDCTGTGFIGVNCQTVESNAVSVGKAADTGKTLSSIEGGSSQLLAAGQNSAPQLRPTPLAALLAAVAACFRAAPKLS